MEPGRQGLTPSKTTMIGQTISHYRVVGKLGVGGMGVVYDAQDERLARRVALKFLPDELAGDPDATRRFRREAQTIALLNHPQICTIYEVDEHDGRTFIAMERLDGSNLKAHMARKTLETPEIVDIAMQIAGALDAAHSKGVIHRDIKPGNVFISETGRVKVLDFGLARRVPTEDAGPLGLDGSTMPGRPVGTASYMAPERILQMPLDARCDLFSLGVVMYEMATGRLPFAAASPAETVTNILEKEPTPVLQLSPNRSGQLGRIINKLLAKNPEERYQTAKDLQHALLGVTTTTSSNFLGRLVDRLRRPSREA
jgi:serine/threonine protein kinase